MPNNDVFTLSLLTNDEVLGVNQSSTDNREIFEHNGFRAWIANVPGTNDKYLALFNTRPPYATEAAAAVPVKLADIGFPQKVRVRDLWQHKDLGSFDNEFAPNIKAHGAGLYGVTSLE